MEHIGFKHPFTCLVTGPTGSGKTVLIRRVLQNHRILISGLEHPKVLWCYGEWQPLYNSDSSLIMHYEGFPGDEFLDDFKPNIIVIDDLMMELEKDKRLANLFTKMSHHRGISVIFLIQNLFMQSDILRTVSRNAHYMILMKNPRDKLQVHALARQIFPNNSKCFIEAYEDATREPYAYIKVDFTQGTPDEYRLQTRITPEEHEKEFEPIVYMPKCLKTS